MALNWTGGLLFASEDDDFYWTSIEGLAWPPCNPTFVFVLSFFWKYKKYFICLILQKMWNYFLNININIQSRCAA